MAQVKIQLGTDVKTIVSAMVPRFTICGMSPESFTFELLGWHSESLKTINPSNVFMKDLRLVQLLERWIVKNSYNSRKHRVSSAFIRIEVNVIVGLGVN